MNECCYLPDPSDASAPPGHDGTGDLFRLQTGDHPEDYTEACRNHLGWLVDGLPGWAAEPWRQTVVTRASADG